MRECWKKQERQKEQQWENDDSRNGFSSDSKLKQKSKTKTTHKILSQTSDLPIACCANISDITSVEETFFFSSFSLLSIANDDSQRSYIVVHCWACVVRLIWNQYCSQCVLKQKTVHSLELIITVRKCTKRVVKWCFITPAVFRWMKCDTPQIIIISRSGVWYWMQIPNDWMKPTIKNQLDKRRENKKLKLKFRCIKIWYFLDNWSQWQVVSDKCVRVCWH